MSDASAMPVFGAAEQNAQAPNTQQVNTTATAGTSHLGATNRAATAETFGSMEELRKREPTLYRLMIEGCMQQFCRDQQWHNRNLKRIMRENQT